MPAYDNLHSRVVSWLKIILPLAALALLSTVFLVARRGDNGTSVPFSKLDLEEMASEQHVEGPDFASVADEGQRVVVSADRATPRGGDPDVVDATGVRGRLQTLDGDTIDVTSEAGTIFSKKSQTILRGNVEIVTSNGYRLTTEELIADMDRSELETTGPVSGEGPLGTIDAGRMTVTATEGAEDAFTVVFKDGVKLIYLPQTQ